MSKCWLSPLLCLVALGCTLADALLFPGGWHPGGLYSEQAGEWWRFLSYAFFLGPVPQAILALLTIALVGPGLEQQRGGAPLLAGRWLLATLALGACQSVAPPLAITGATLVGTTLLAECMLSSYQKEQPAPWKTWGTLLVVNLASALLEGWIVPTLFLSLFLGALFTVVSQRYLGALP
jgi:hypothetical protein